MMENKKLDGLGHQIKGAVKQGLGKLIGDAKLAADGTTERVDGSAEFCEAAADDRPLGIDPDRIKGVAHQLKGSLTAGLGNVLGNAALEAKGIAERDAGKRQNREGSARDTAIEATGTRSLTID